MVLLRDCLNPANPRIFSQWHQLLPNPFHRHLYRPPIPSPDSPSWWLQCIPQTVGCHWPTVTHKPKCKMCKDWPTSGNVTFTTECKWTGIGTRYHFFAVGSFFCFAYSLLTAWPYVPSLLLSLPSRKTNQLEMCLQNCICYLLQGQFFKPGERQT